jgi:hypothetical protein
VPKLADAAVTADSGGAGSGADSLPGGADTVGGAAQTP